MADAKKQLDLVVNVVGKGDGGSALSGLDRVLGGLQQSIDKLGRSIEQTGNKAEAAAKDGPGFLGGLKDQVAGKIGTSAKVLGTLTAITVGVTRFSDAMDKLGYNFLTTREKAQALAEAIPFIGSTIANFISTTLDAMDRLSAPGAARQLAYDQLNMGAELATGRARAGYQRQVYGIRQQDLTAGYGAQALAELPSLASQMGRAYLGGTTDRGFGAFAAFAAENDPLRDAKEAERSAQRALRAAQLGADASAADLAGARETSGRANDEWNAARRKAEAETDAVLRPTRVDGKDAPGRNDYSRLRAEGKSRGAALGGLVVGGLYDAGRGVASLFTDVGENELDKERAKFDRAARGGGSGNKIDALAALNKEQRALATAQNALADLEQKITTNKERQLDLLKKQADVARAQTNIMKGQLAILDEQAAKVKGGARQFGGMDDFNRAGIVNAFKRFQEQGREGVSAGELALLQGNALTGEEVNKRLEKDASKDPEFQKLLKLTGNRDLATIEEERKKLRAEIDLKVQLDEEQAAKAVEAAFKKLNVRELLGEFIRKEFEMNVRGIRAEADRARLERS